MHLAVENEFLEIIKLLLKNKGIDIDVNDNKGRKPIDYAINNEIKQLLNH